MPRKKPSGGPPPVAGQDKAPPKPEKAELDRQVLFAIKYVQLGCRGVPAARAAGYQGDDATLQTTSFRLLRNDKVKSHLARVRADGIMDAIHTLFCLTAVASEENSLEPFLDDEGYIDTLAAREAGVLHLAQEITEEVWMEKTGEVDENGKPDWGQVRSRKVKLYSRLDALKTLAKYHGLLAEIVGRDIPQTPEEAKVLLAKHLQRIWGDKLPPGMIPPDVLALMEAQGGVQ